MTDMRLPPESSPLWPSVPLESPSVRKESEIELSAEEVDARTRARQEEFIERVFRPHERMVRMCVGMRVKAARVKDLVQDVFLKAWRRDVVTRCGGDDRRIEAYLRQMARNCVNDSNRSEHRDDEGAARYSLSLQTEANDRERPSEYAILCDMRRHVARGIQELPPRCREVYIKVRLRGMSYQDTATALQITVTTVSVQLRIAHRLLREKLAAVGYYSLPEIQGEEKEDTP